MADVVYEKIPGDGGGDDADEYEAAEAAEAVEVDVEAVETGLGAGRGPYFASWD